MNEEARALLKKLLMEGKRNDDVRRGLISEGYITNDYEEVYREVAEELDIKDVPPEKVPVVPDQVMQEEARAYSKKAEETQRSRVWSNIFKIIISFLFIIVVILFFSGIGPSVWHSVFGTYKTSNETQSPVDIARESQLRTLQIAADVYQSKLLDYRGLCSSIGIDPEVYNCTEDTDSFAIEAALSNGKYFCVDDTGFAGVVDISHGGKSVCPVESYQP